jgi:arylsulfatase A-like enzyme
VRILVSCLALLCLQCGAAGPAANRPNVVVILADDLGWGSLGSYGASGVETPSLDRLAREGRRFTQVYAPGSVCTPSRYAVLTGRYFWRTSIKDGRTLPPATPLHIEAHRTTLPSLFRSHGYATAAFGKWHLGFGDPPGPIDWAGPLAPGPRAIGFDYFFGLAANPANPPHRFVENEGVLGEPFEPARIMETLTARVTSWIRQNRGARFFLYYAPNAVHEPVAPGPIFTGSRLGRYGDFIHELDWSVGQLLATLDELALADRTLVIFTSDNGGLVDSSNASSAQAMASGLAINGVLRGGKADVWEGGFREPFLVRWPGRVPANSVSDQVICLTDLLATLARVLDVQLPEGQGEDSVDVLRAFREQEAGAPVRGHVVLQAADATYAIRAENWKLVERTNPPAFEPRNPKRAQRDRETKLAGHGQDELFDLAADPSETTDVSAAHPEVVKRLRERLASERRPAGRRS